MSIDAILFTVSQPNMSARKWTQMQSAFCATAELPTALCRLEGSGPPLVEMLSAFRDEGHRRILVQPIGLPFSESLFAWLRGALADWQQQEGNDTVSLLLGEDLSTLPALADSLSAWALERADTAQPVSAFRPSLGKPGWNDPPDFTHHLLVCTGARCQYRDAASLLQSLKDEASRQGVSHKCLTTRTGCLFPCNKGPMVAVYPRGEWYHLPDAESVSRFISTVVAADQTLSEQLIFTASRAGTVAQ